MIHLNLKTNLQNLEEKKKYIKKLVDLATKNIFGKNEHTVILEIEKLPFKSWHINSKYSTSFIIEMKTIKDLNVKNQNYIYLNTIFDGLKTIEKNISFASYIFLKTDI